MWPYGQISCERFAFVDEFASPICTSGKVSGDAASRSACPTWQQRYTAGIVGSDPDGQALTYHALTLPRGAAFAAATRVFLWTRSAWQPADTVAVFGASDGDTTVTRTVALHAATANQPPALAWAGAPPDTVSWDAPLALSVADAEGNPVRIGGTVSTDGGVHWAPMAASGDTGRAAAPRAASVTWRTVGQLPGRSLATARVRLVPADTDVGAPLERDVRVLNLPCDWDHDGRIGLADFATLRQGWQTQDTTKNLGPYRIAGGDALPNIVRAQDRRIDFDDLMAFALLWDWAAGRGRVRLTARIAAERPTGPTGADLVTLRPIEGDQPAVEVCASRGLASRVLGLTLALPTAVARTVRVERGAWVGADGWWLVRADAAAGLVEAWVARGSDAAGDVVATLRLPPGTERLSMHVTYEALSGPGDVPLVGGLSREVSLVPVPVAWSLAAAPNPFNPATTIRYEVPAATHVRLAVYDVLGREVVALVDERREPGCYAVAWDGRDAAGRSVASGVYVVRLEAGDVGWRSG